MKNKTSRLKKKGPGVFSHCRQKKGQATVEMVLLLSAMIAVVYLVQTNFQTSKPIYNFISGPWKTIGGMIESGSWKKRASARDDHPNHWKRMYAKEGITPN